MLQTRVEKLRKFLKENNLDGFLISNFYSLLYLTQFKTLTPDEREAWGLVTKNSIYLFTDSRYINPDFKMANNKFLVFKLITPEKGLINHLTDIIKDESLQRVGFEGDDLKVGELQKFTKYLEGPQFISVEKLIIKIREIKDDEEIKKMRNVCKIADLCLSDVVKMIRPGISEKEIAFKIELWLKEQGYDLSFYPIVAIDKNSAVPHYDTRNGNDEKVKKNSIILIDYGAKSDDYLSDTTRMIFTGKPTDEMINIYEALLSAQKKTIDELKVDNNPVSIDQFCRKQLTASPLLDNYSYPHSTGHGVGLQIHEYPKISYTSTDVLLPNQIVTVEPGVYLDHKWGMRIEDTVLIKEKNEIEVLTKFEKKLLVI
jgi:Xaa-Pro aminopeptidase